MNNQELLHKAASVVNKWASQYPEINKVYFFGSRVKGSHRPDSDLDIGITLSESKITPGKFEHFSQEVAVDLYWSRNRQCLSEELQSGLPVEIDLWLYEPDKPNPYVCSGEKLLVYSR